MLRVMISRSIKEFIIGIIFMPKLFDLFLEGIVHFVPFHRDNAITITRTSGTTTTTSARIIATHTHRIGDTV